MSKANKQPILRRGVNATVSALKKSPVTNNIVTNNMVTRAVATVATTLAKDPGMQKLVAHGASELANSFVKGEVAPIYTGSFAPASTDPGSVFGPANDTPTQPEGSVYGPADPTSSPEAPTGFDAMTDNSPSQEPETATPDLASEPGILENLIENAQEMAQQPEMEMEQQPDITDD